MTEQELREKIVKILEEYRDWFIEEDYKRDIAKIDYTGIADALIATGIGDVSEWKHQTEVLRLALSKSVLDENAIFDDDVCRYILSNTKLTEEYYIKQAEKELAEEKKSD